MTARIVFLDIERTWGVAEGIWQLKQSWINPSQMIEQPRTICLAWKWEGEDRTQFAAEWQRGGHTAMVLKAHKVLDEADYVVGWNSKGFDVKHLRTEFILADLTPPSPHKDIDLMLTARKNFGFMSNRMGFIAEQLDLKGKTATGGAELWKKLREAKGSELADARDLMAGYNCRDVELTQELYYLMRPWVTGLNLPTHEEGESVGPSCSNCNSDDVHYRGIQVATSRRYRRFQCQQCGKWGRETASDGSVGAVGV